MNLDIRNWLGVVVLLCLGFIVGRLTATPDIIVKPSEVTVLPQESEIGRYQLAIGEVEVAFHSVDHFDDSGYKDKTSHTREKTLFRIDTMSGKVDMYDGIYSLATKDSLTSIYKWTNITERRREF